MFGGTLATDSALGECNKCVCTGQSLDVTNPVQSSKNKPNICCRMSVILVEEDSWIKEIRLDFLYFFKDVSPLIQEASTLLYELLGIVAFAGVLSVSHKRFSESHAARSFGAAKNTSLQVL